VLLIWKIAFKTRGAESEHGAWTEQLKRISTRRIVERKTECGPTTGADDIAVRDNHNSFAFVFLKHLWKNLTVRCAFAPFAVRRNFFLVRVAVNNLIVLGQLAAKIYFFRLDIFLILTDYFGRFSAARFISDDKTKSKAKCFKYLPVLSACFLPSGFKLGPACHGVESRPDVIFPWRTKVMRVSFIAITCLPAGREIKIRMITFSL